MDKETFDWLGISGTAYKFWVYPIYTSWKPVPGIYIYAKRDPYSNRWEAVYIGQTENLSQRLAGHEKEAQAIKNGATHIHARAASGNLNERLSIERDLIRKWAPNCNDQIL